MIRNIISFVAFAAVLVANASAQKGPGILADYITPGKTVQGEIVVVMPPEEINQYLTKVEAAAQKDPEWFVAHSKTSKPGEPLAFDERLGLTQEEYDNYLELWKAREFKVVDRVKITLKEGRKGYWKLAVSGRGAPIRLMSYDSESDTWKGLTGELARIKDIDAKESSILGAWTGNEWKLEEETPLGKEKTNLAIGRMAKGGYGLLIYRYQEAGAPGGPRYDQSLVIRFKPVLPAK